MSRRIFLQVTGPAVLIGVLLLGACLAAVWSINRLQTNLATILSSNVASLEAAQELEIQLRQLSFHSLLYVMDPSPERWKPIEENHRGFESAVRRARAAAHTDEERRLVAAIEGGYEMYRRELERAATDPPRMGGLLDYVRWADAHPVRHLIVPCEELLRLNKDAMGRAARESAAVSGRVSLAMLVLGLTGPAAGLIGGFGIARGLSRSLARLHVRVEDVRAHLEREVGPFKLAAGGDLEALDRQLQRVVGRVREVVTQMQRQQEEMLRSEQLAAVGQLAAAVAHEIRNPLTAIKLLVGAAVRKPGRSGLTPEDLRVIHAEVERLERTVQNLLDFARPPAPRREPWDLRRGIDRALDLVRPRIDQLGVSVEVAQTDGAAVAPADPDQMGTVLVNLLLNALDAMPRGGRLRIGLDPGPREVRITVEDTGAGIPPEVAARLFTPFASSKPTGTGLGLSICRRVLRDHGGDVTAANRPEGGARFTVILPRHAQEEVHAEAAGRR